MIILIHGEDIASSRNFLTEQRQTHKGEVQLITPETTSPELLTQAFTSSSLFETNRLIILEGFFTGRKTTVTKEIPKLESSANIIIWEGKKLTLGQISVIEKIFPGVSIKEFKQNQVVFKFVESIRPKNQKQMLTLLQEYFKVEIPEIVFSMIVRQLRLLLLIKSGSADELSPWQKSRLEAQAKSFNFEQLKSIYAQLLDIDFKIKSGQLAYNLPTAIELFLLDL